ncbi:hypothetical protein MRX96_052948 [Rhipicephalus microplus]
MAKLSMMEKLQGVPKSTLRVAASNMAALDVVKLMAWSRTAKVGCGATDCPQLNGRYMVCNYEPG